MHQQVEVVGWAICGRCRGGRADQALSRAGAALRYAWLMRCAQCLVGLLAPLILGLLCAQLSTELFADGRLRLQIAQGRGQLFSVQVSVVLGLMLASAARAPAAGLLACSIAVALQLQAQLADLFVAVAQQLRKACVVEFRVQGFASRRPCSPVLAFAVQRLAVVAALSSAASWMSWLTAPLQLLAGRGLCLARLLEGLFSCVCQASALGCSPSRCAELLLGAVQLGAEAGRAAVARTPVCCSRVSWRSCLLFPGSAGVACCDQLFTLQRQLFQTLGHLLVELEEGRRGLMAQAFKDGCREQVGEGGELFLLQALAIVAQFALLRVSCCTACWLACSAACSCCARRGTCCTG